ncbi:hypothetical protein BIW11_06053, partial [Tropilaelaps mercedesae]
AECRDRVYDILQDVFPFVEIDMCLSCLKLNKQTTDNCLMDKSRCVRCGEESDHDEKICNLVCFRRGEMEKDATHHHCLYYRKEFIRCNANESKIKRILDNVSILKKFLISNGVSPEDGESVLGT